MTKKYVNEDNLQIAMTEYQTDMETVGRRVQTEYGKTVGYIGQVYDNEHGSGEQVYVAILLSRLIYVIL